MTFTIIVEEILALVALILYGVVIFARHKITHDPLAIKILSIKAYIANSDANTELSEIQYERNLNFLKNETEMNANFNHLSIMKVKNRSDATSCNNCNKTC